MSEYNIIIEKDEATGMFCGQCEQVPEAISQGATEEELLENIREAIELVLEDRQESVRRQYMGRNYFSRRIAVNA
jgi:predicted RNase H-like HicB family nuclease